MTRGKKYQQIKEKIDPQRKYTLDEALTLLQENKIRSFDESIEIHLKLGINVKKTEQTVKGNIILPYGGFSQKKIAVFVEPEKIKEAKEAGADLVGGKELIEQIRETGKTNFDVAIATPAIMKDLIVLAKILGPKGLMPSPHNGTITTDIHKAIMELRKGKISFKNDESGNLHQVVGKISWEKEKIIANIKTFLEAVRKSKPTKLKGNFIKSITLCSTMGPGIKVSV